MEPPSRSKPRREKSQGPWCVVRGGGDAKLVGTVTEPSANHPVAQRDGTRANSELLVS